MHAVCPSQSSFSVLFRVYRCCPIKVKLVWKTCVYFSYERIVFVRQLLFVWFYLSSVHTQRDRRANLWISKQWSQSFRYIIKRHFREIFCLCFCEFTLVQFFFFFFKSTITNQFLKWTRQPKTCSQEPQLWWSWSWCSRWLRGRSVSSRTNQWTLRFLHPSSNRTRPFLRDISDPWVRGQLLADTVSVSRFGLAVRR